MKKRLLSLLLTVSLVTCMLPTTLATNTAENADPVETLILEQAEAYGLLDYGPKLEWSTERLDLYKIVFALGKFELQTEHKEPFPFTDCDDLTEEERDLIQTLYALDLVYGMGNNTFYPQQNMTRAQVATMICQVIEHLKPDFIDASTKDTFEDVPSEHWYYSAVGRLNQIGIFTTEESIFDPHNITNPYDTLRWSIAAYEWLYDEAVSDVSLSETAITIQTDTPTLLTANLSATDTAPLFLWTSSNEEIVSLSDTDTTSATLIGNSVGEATITIQLANGNSAECTVNVVAAEQPTKITVADNINVAVGEQHTVDITLTPENAATQYAVVSNNPHILTAKTINNQTAVEIVGINPGIASITITTENGLSATASVQVGDEDDTPHTFVDIPSVEATCTTHGYTAGTKCSVCEEIIVSPVELPMADHKTEIVNAKPATEAETGYTGDEVCTVCGQTIRFGTVIPKITHSSGGSSDPTYSISTPKYENGTVKLSKRYAEKGEKVTLTVTPKEGFELSELVITDRRGRPIEYIDNQDGTFTFTMPSGRIEIEALFSEIVPEIDVTEVFSDISPDAWYVGAVSYVVNNGLMGGCGNGEFSPNTNLTRAMLAQILYNSAGQPSVDPSNIYTDVDSSSWYSDAVVWATENNIVGGYGNGLFGTNDSITREQLAVMLWRYARSPDSTYELTGFHDAELTHDYAVTAMRWAVEQGIIAGNGQGVLDPNGTATRAQVAQILMNFF